MSNTNVQLQLSNAQVALIAAAHLNAGKSHPSAHYVESDASNFLEWLEKHEDPPML